MATDDTEDQAVPLVRPSGESSWSGSPGTDGPVAALKRSPVEGSSCVPDAPIRVLVVDPDERSRSLLESGLSRHGFEVATAASGMDAARLLGHERALPSVVISEIELMGDDGFSFCSRLREDQRTAQLPVVLLARQVTAKHLELASAAGADDFLSKPLFLEDVVSIARLLAHRSASNGRFLVEVADLPPGKLLRALLSGMRSGQLALEDERAWVTFRDGAVVDAGFRELRAEPAMTRVLMLGRGRYSVSFGPVSGRPAFLLRLEDFCSRIHPLLARWERMVPRSVPLDCVLQLDFAQLSAQLSSLPDGLSPLLRLCDGRRSVRDCLVDSPLLELTALEVLGRLYASGVLVAGARSASVAGPPPRRAELSPEQARQLDAFRIHPVVESPVPAHDPEVAAFAEEASDDPYLHPAAFKLVTPDALGDEGELPRPLPQGGALERSEISEAAAALAEAAISPPESSWLSADDLLERGAVRLPLTPATAVARLGSTAVWRVGTEPGVERGLPTDAFVGELPPVPERVRLETAIPSTVFALDPAGAPEEVLSVAAIIPLTQLVTEPVPVPSSAVPIEAEASRPAASVSPAPVTASALSAEAAVAETPRPVETVSQVPVTASVLPSVAEASRPVETVLPAPVDASGFPAEADEPAASRSIETVSQAPGALGGSLTAAAVAPVHHAPIEVVRFPPPGAQRSPRDVEEAMHRLRESYSSDSGSSAEDAFFAPDDAAPMHGRRPLRRALVVAAIVGVGLVLGLTWALLAGSEPAPVARPPEPPPLQAVAVAPAPEPSIPVVEAPPPAPAPLPAPVAPVAQPNRASLERGIALYEAGAATEAVATLEQVVALEPPAPGFLMLGLAKFDARNPQGAEQAARKALEIDARNGRALMLLASIYIDGGQKEKATVELERYLQLEPHGPYAAEARQLLGRAR